MISEWEREAISDNDGALTSAVVCPTIDSINNLESVAFVDQRFACIQSLLHERHVGVSE
jgi:hypothetical protein